MIKSGDHITLKADEDEGWPEQRGIVEGVDELSWGTCVTVRLDAEFREDSRDDGLREVTLDQLL